MFKVETFKAEDLDQIDPHPIYSGSGNLLKSQSKAIQSLTNSHAVSLYLDGKVEACIGMFVLWDGNADVWTYISNKCKEHPIAFHKAVARILDAYQNGLGAKRVSAGTPANFTEGCRWLESLGFKVEGKMLKYGPDGSDWWLYARVI